MDEEGIMDFDTFDEGLRLVEQASNILETISNEPGVTPVQFCAALDSVGILDDLERAKLTEAAATVEMALVLLADDDESTIH